jgi:hypothetical protein
VSPGGSILLFCENSSFLWIKLSHDGRVRECWNKGKGRSVIRLLAFFV